MDQVAKVEMPNDIAPEDINAISEAQGDLLEREIAKKYLQIVPWGAVVWGLLNCLVFVSLFPLVLLEMLPLWAAFPIATLNCMLCYLPSHEAQHNIIAGKGRPLRWLNELVGHVSTIPIASPYRVLRATHMQHHAHCNDPELDPDYSVHADSNAEFFVNYLKNLQPAGPRSGAYAECLRRIGKSELLLDAVIFEAVFLAVMFSMAWTGHAIEAALLWWLPKMIAQAHLLYYLSWAPHFPGHEQGRYRDTRGFKSRLGNFVSAGMQYHIVHHLYPRIPLSLTPAAYRELKPLLQKRGCELGAL